MTDPRDVPGLPPGDRQPSDEIERCFRALSPEQRAAIVHGAAVPAPTVPYAHGRALAVLAHWLGQYELATPAVEFGLHCSLRLDREHELQPAAVLRLPERAGGRSRATFDGYLGGPPELVVAVAADEHAPELQQELQAHRRGGVGEYLVYRVEDRAIDWFLLERGEYVRQQPDAEGLLKSRAFPGLWLSPDALLAADLGSLRQLVERGCAGEEHAVFVRRLTVG